MKRLGYLCSEFPALSHTFISREISILEKEGFTILTASVNPTKGLQKMDSEDQARAASTYCLKTTPAASIVLHSLCYLLRPISFFGALGYSLRLAWFGGPGSPVKAFGYFFQAILLHKWAAERGIAHVHVHFANPAASVALIARRFGKFEFSLSVHGPDEFYDVTANNLREKIAAAVFVRCIGYFCRSQLMRLSSPDQWSKFHIVRCGLFRGEMNPRPPRTGPALSILSVGRLCPSKGQFVLIEAAKLLTRKGLRFRLTLLGGGEDFEAFSKAVEKEGLAERIEAVGPVGHERVKEYLATADVFVLPSFAEGIPVALMEAMAAGVPVVSTAIAGIPELIENGVDGFLTYASDAEQLAAVLELFILGQIDTKKLVENAAKKIRTCFDVEQNTRSLASLFDSLEEPK